MSVIKYCRECCRKENELKSGEILYECSNGTHLCGVCEKAEKAAHEPDALCDCGKEKSEASHALCAECYEKAEEAYKNEPDNSPIETDGVYVDKCECGNWKVSQDAMCSLCFKGSPDELDKLRIEIAEMKKLNKGLVKYGDSYKSECDTLRKELNKQKAHTSHYKSKLKELESYDKAEKKRMGLELEELKRERSVLISRIRRMERQRSLALLALEEEI